VFDLWEENAYTEFERTVARVLERRLLSGAARVVVHCREMADHYRRKHGIDCLILPTPVEPPDSSQSVAVEDEAIREVLYAGAVYWAQEDALRRLSRVVARIGGATLTIVGAWADREALSAKGIAADRFEGELSESGFRRRLKEASVLFVGLGFDSPHPD